MADEPHLYEIRHMLAMGAAADEASAERPDRTCPSCWSAQARKYQERRR